MTTQTIPAVRAGARPARYPIVLLAALLAGAALLGQPSAARAQGRFAFTKMVVEHCDKVVGSCVWKLGCNIEGKENDFVSGAKVGTAGSVAIDKSFPVRQFPVPVRCSLAIDDGWIGTSWKKVAEGTLEIPAGGNYSVDFKAVGQGTVHLHVAADSLEMAGPAPAPAAPAGKGKGKAAAATPRQWLGVFHSGDEGHAVVVGLEWPAFKARVDALAAKGVKVVHLLTYKEPGKDGRRLWAGVFRTAEEEQTVVSGLEWEAAKGSKAAGPFFKNKWTELTGKSQRLVDLVTYDDGKKRLFTGVFREGGEPYSLWVGLDRQAFIGKWNEVTGGGLRLIDLTAYHAGKNLVYAGVFRAGTGSYGLLPALSWDTLKAKSKEASQNGSEIIQLQTYEEGKKRLYDAVLRNSSGIEELVAPLDPAAFAAKWNELTGKGMRLIDLETIPEEQ